MAVAFHSSDSAVIEQHVDIQHNADIQRIEDPALLESIYEIPRCISWIEKNEFKKVALQFPDEMLADATSVALELEKCTSVSVYILGPSSYGSCCVNEIGAEHASVDAIIHFGHSCLTPVNSYPVLHVFSKADIDANHAAEQFKQMFPAEEAKVLILYDVVYSHAIGSFVQCLGEHYLHIFVSSLDCEDSEMDKSVCQDKDVTTIYKNGRRIALPKDVTLDTCAVFYIGEENLLLTNLMLSFSKCKFCLYNPRTKACQWESPKVNKTLMKRYYLIECAKDAKIVGIVVGSVGISKYLDILDHLRHMLKQAGKKSYTLVIGKPSVTSLGNFPEIDVFVLVSCLENSLLDSKDFYKPVVTPFEMEMACNQARQWNGEYVVDFRDILPDGSSYVPLSTQEGSEGDVSLVSGKIRSLGMAENAVGDSESLLPQNDARSIATLPSGNILLSRSWQGLEQKLGQTPVAEIREGRTGIASGYVDERNNS